MKKLGDAELEIMKVLWKQDRPATSGEILEGLEGCVDWKLSSLMTALNRLAEKGLTVEYLDITIVAQKPKLAPYMERMKETIAADLGISPERMNIKATTEEKMGFTGRCEGISTHAVCLLAE